ncbi:TerB family tellurite resistance protein [Falsihalocynthiibacter sp. BN13B15]|uniref:tellurite resistance TerB family protein n=1 Tax=Falsihalocynthiibacter sp. BN13B15 TaxID=3240871 RepID=UPI00350F457B
MIDKIFSLFAPEAEPQKLDDRIAIAGLLVRIARTDGDYSHTEIARIDRILAKRYEITPEKTTELRQEAEVFEKSAPDTVRFTRSIKDSVPHDEREAVIEALWEVVLADGVRNTYEDTLMRLLANLLGITDMDSARCRQRVLSNQ